MQVYSVDRETSECYHPCCNYKKVCGVLVVSKSVKGVYINGTNLFKINASRCTLSRYFIQKIYPPLLVKIAFGEDIIIRGINWLRREHSD